MAVFLAQMTLVIQEITLTQWRLANGNSRSNFSFGYKIIQGRDYILFIFVLVFFSL